MLSLQLGVKMSIDKAVITTTTMFDMITTLDKHSNIPAVQFTICKVLMDFISCDVE